MAESADPDQGTLFIVELPMVRAVESVALGDSEHPYSGERLDDIRVLVVDDDADERELFGAILQRSGAAALAGRSISS